MSISDFFHQVMTNYGSVMATVFSTLGWFGGAIIVAMMLYKNLDLGQKCGERGVVTAVVYCLVQFLLAVFFISMLYSVSEKFGPLLDFSVMGTGVFGLGSCLLGAVFALKSIGTREVTTRKL